MGSHQVGAYGHVDPQQLELVQRHGPVDVVGVVYAGDRPHAVALGDGARHHVDLVGPGDGDEVLRLPNAGLLQVPGGRRIATDDQGVQALGPVGDLLVGFDDGHLVTFAVQGPGNVESDLPSAGYDDAHACRRERSA